SMKIERSSSPRAYFASNVTDLHIQAVVTDPERVVLQETEGVYRIVGLTYPLRDGRMAIFSPTSPYSDPALLEVVYEDQGEVAHVMFAAEADEEELERWIQG
ncbi:MAG: hypothetical protein KGR26_04415, partial [Cyanobacteria bacterium REEB65]|nr:hypothetical protein [Cyanobacteria bacterium REEB65]